MPDVIVIGGGPAGASAAFTLAAGGADVVLLDRAEFPRDKTCGDGLTPAAVARLIAMGVDLSDARTVSGYSFIHTRSDRRTDEMFRGGQEKKGAAMRRHVLDSRMLAAAVGAGTTLRTATVSGLVRNEQGRVCGVDFTHDGRRGRLYAATTIIAAGAAGRSLFTRDGDERIWSVAGRTYITLEKHQRETLDHLELYFPLAVSGRTIPGYAWIFPVSQTHANIGVGLARTQGFRGVSIRELLVTFAQEHANLSQRQIAEVANGEIATAPLAIGESDNSAQGVLLCGDAAGLGNPFTGEGIAGALLSGDAAGQAILDADGSGEGWRQVATDYDATLGRLLKRNVRLVRTIRATLDKPEFFHGRAADLCFARGRRCQGWIRRIIHDETHGELHESVSTDADEAVNDLARDLSSTARSCEPLFSPLLEEFLADEDIEFGALLRAALTTFDDLDAESAAQLRRIASVLEIARLVEGLLGGLASTNAIEAAQEWGCNTTELVLADVLNAYALRLLASLPPRWSKSLSEHLACHFAANSLEQSPSTLLANRPLAEILAAAGCGGEPESAVSESVVRRVERAMSDVADRRYAVS